MVEHISVTYENWGSSPQRFVYLHINVLTENILIRIFNTKYIKGSNFQGTKRKKTHYYEFFIIIIYYRNIRFRFK